MAEPTIAECIAALQPYEHGICISSLEAKATIAHLRRNAQMLEALKAVLSHGALLLNVPAIHKKVIAAIAAAEGRE